MKISSFSPVRSSFIISYLLLSLACSSAFAQQTKPKSALDTADIILQQMSRITGLPIKSPLQKRLISKSEIEKYLQENLHAEYTPGEVHGQEAALKAFGVVGPDFDLEAFLVSFYTEQAAGFYDPRRQTMFMADWIEPDQQKMVLAHELTHALQDQSFDLWKFMHATRDKDDSTAAREALVEGYATLAMLQTMLGSLPTGKLPSLGAMMDAVVNQQMAGFPVFSGAPFFLRFEALFPYTEGMHFVLRGFELGGWKRLDDTFRDPPVTTQQIFEPDLYFNPSQPVTSGALNAQRAPNPVAARGSAAARPAATSASGGASPLALPTPPALESAPGVRQVEADTMGELGYRALLGQLVSQDEAQRLGKSWGADSYLVYEGPAPGEFTLIARTRWSDAAAAQAFCRDYQTILEKRWPEPGAKPGSKEQGTGDSTQGTGTGKRERITEAAKSQRPNEPARAANGAVSGGTPEVLLETRGPRRAILLGLLGEANECRWAEGVAADRADAVEKWLAALK